MARYDIGETIVYTGEVSSKTHSNIPVPPRLTYAEDPLDLDGDEALGIIRSIVDPLDNSEVSLYEVGLLLHDREFGN